MKTRKLLKLWNCFESFQREWTRQKFFHQNCCDKWKLRRAYIWMPCNLLISKQASERAFHMQVLQPPPFVEIAAHVYAFVICISSGKHFVVKAQEVCTCEAIVNWLNRSLTSKVAQSTPRAPSSFAWIKANQNDKKITKTAVKAAIGNVDNLNLWKNLNFL